MQPPDVTAEPVDRATLDRLAAVPVPVARVLERAEQLHGHVVRGRDTAAQQLAKRRCLARLGVTQRGDVADRGERLAEPARRVAVGQVLPADLEGVLTSTESRFAQEVHDGLSAVAALGLGGLLVGRSVRRRRAGRRRRGRRGTRLVVRAGRPPDGSHQENEGRERSPRSSQDRSGASPHRTSTSAWVRASMRSSAASSTTLA